MNAPAYMSKATLATTLDISESTVDEMVRRGVLPKPVRLSSGCVRWRWETVDAALASMMPRADGEVADPYMRGIKNAAQNAAQGRAR
jgi:predicted DNA-binding transcriptional regulator AlpA